MMVTVCQLDNRETQRQPMLDALAAHTATEQTQLLLLPEMCFSEWLAADRDVDPKRWQAAAAEHDRQIASLDRFDAAAVIGTRAIVNESGRRRNQAYCWTPDEGARAVHEKYYLPDEAGYWEASWYERGERRFDTCRAAGVTGGIPICTEMWFLEWARPFARAGIEVLCVPRATPHGSPQKWLAGGRTAAVCAGAYCLSSNLWNPPGATADCGGLGWIISPEGDVLAQTDDNTPFASCDIDIDFARLSKQTYPRYVAE